MEREGGGVPVLLEGAGGSGPESASHRGGVWDGRVGASDFIELRDAPKLASHDVLRHENQVECILQHRSRSRTWPLLSPRALQQPTGFRNSHRHNWLRALDHGEHAGCAVEMRVAGCVIRVRNSNAGERRPRQLSSTSPFSPVVVA